MPISYGEIDNSIDIKTDLGDLTGIGSDIRSVLPSFLEGSKNRDENRLRDLQDKLLKNINNSNFSAAGWKVDIEPIEPGVLDSDGKIDFRVNATGDTTEIRNLATNTLSGSGLENQYKITVTPFESQEKNESQALYNRLSSLGIDDGEISTQVRGDALINAQAQYAYDNQPGKGTKEEASVEDFKSIFSKEFYKAENYNILQNFGAGVEDGIGSLFRGVGNTLDVARDAASYPGRKLQGLIFNEDVSFRQEGGRLSEGIESFFGETEQEQFIDEVTFDAINLGIQEADSKVRLGGRVAGEIATIFSPGVFGKAAGIGGNAIKGAGFGAKASTATSNIATKGVLGTYFLSGLSPVTEKINNGEAVSGQDFTNAILNTAPFGVSGVLRRANITQGGRVNQGLLAARNVFESSPFKANVGESLFIEGVRTATTDATFNDFILEMGVTAALSRATSSNLRTKEESDIVSSIDNILKTETGDNVKQKIIEEVGDKTVQGVKISKIFENIEKGDYQDITSGLTDIWFRYNQKVAINSEDSQRIKNHIINNNDFSILNDSSFAEKITDKTNAVSKSSEVAKLLEDRAKELNISNITTSLKGEVESLNNDIRRYKAVLDSSENIGDDTRGYINSQITKISEQIDSIEEKIATKDEDLLIETITDNGVISNAENIIKSLDKEYDSIRQTIEVEKNTTPDTDKNIERKVKNILLKSGFNIKETNQILNKRKKGESISEFLESTQDIMRRNLVKKAGARMRQIQKGITGFTLKNNKTSKKRIRDIETRSKISEQLQLTARVAIINYQKALKDYGNAMSTVFKNVFIDSSGNRVEGSPQRVKKEFGIVKIQKLPKDKQKAYFYGNNEISKKFYEELKEKNKNRVDISEKEVYKTDDGKIIKARISYTNKGISVDASLPSTNIVKSGENFFIKKGKNIFAVDDSGNQIKVGERTRVKSFFVEREVTSENRNSFEKDSIKEKTVYEIDGKEVKKINVKKTASDYFEGIMPAYQELIDADRKLENIYNYLNNIDEQALEGKAERKEKILKKIENFKKTDTYEQQKSLGDENSIIKKTGRVISGAVINLTPLSTVFRRGGKVMAEIIPALQRGSSSLSRSINQLTGIRTILEKGARKSGLEIEDIIYYTMYKNNNNLLTKSGRKKYEFFNDRSKDVDGNNTFVNNFFVNKKTGAFYFARDPQDMIDIAKDENSVYRAGVEADLLRIEDQIKNNKDLSDFTRLMRDHIQDRSAKFIETAMIYDDERVADARDYAPIAFMKDAQRNDELGNMTGFNTRSLTMDKSSLEAKTNNAIENAMFDPSASKFFGKIRDTDLYIHMRAGLEDVKTIHDSGKLNSGQMAMVRELVEHISNPKPGNPYAVFLLRKIAGAIYITKLGFRIVQMPVQKIILLTGKLGNKKGFLLSQDYRIYNGRTVREAEIKSNAINKFFGVLDWTGWMRKVRGVQESRNVKDGFAASLKTFQSDIVTARNEGIYGSDRIGYETGMEKFNRIAFLPIKISDSKTTQSFYIGALHKNIEDLTNSYGLKLTEKEMAELAMFGQLPEGINADTAKNVQDGVERAMIEAEVVTAELLQHSDAIFTPVGLRGILGATNNFVLQKTASGEVNFALVSSYDRGKEISQITEKWINGIASQYFPKAVSKEVGEFLTKGVSTPLGVLSTVKGLGFYILASAMFIQFVKDLFKDTLSDGISEDISGIMGSFFNIDYVFDRDQGNYGLPYLQTKQALMGLVMFLGIELDEKDAEDLSNAVKKHIDDNEIKGTAKEKVSGISKYIGTEIKDAVVDYVARGSMGLIDYRTQYNSGGLFSGMGKALKGDALGATTDVLSTVVALGPITKVLKDIQARKKEFLKDQDEKDYIGTFQEYLQDKQENRLLLENKASVVNDVISRIQDLDQGLPIDTYISTLVSGAQSKKGILSESEYAKAIYDGVLESGLPVNESGNINDFGYSVLTKVGSFASKRENTILLDIDRQFNGLKNNFSVTKYIELLEKSSLNILEAQEKLRTDVELGRIPALRGLVIDSELSKKIEKDTLVFSAQEIRTKLRNSDGSTNNGKSAGYNWAKRNKVNNSKRCSQSSSSFSEGCKIYVQSIGGK